MNVSVTTELLTFNGFTLVCSVLHSLLNVFTSDHRKRASKVGTPWSRARKGSVLLVIKAEKSTKLSLFLQSRASIHYGGFGKEKPPPHLK
ncbi:hypothetical protein PROFUN_00536 [Planoprotostelium fungivorum]|uniref:Uncharacterized protein n=1 Tax=Planoprotostelium fungivorum TaxID=1890364 RepID=A0A2P6N157_9EUKA|nr:hypothetical protein PROFUN_00536 [Planoprotostelium fungivorum]